nr:hypothetical protein [uncultured Sphingomonas sp.]
MIALTLALAFAAPNPATLTAPRKAYEACLKDFEKKSVAAKMAKADYSVAVKAACPTESQALVNALVAFDVGMGTKRAAAEENAKMDVADYWAESEERVGGDAAN